MGGNTGKTAQAKMSADSVERVEDDAKEVFKKANDKVDFRTVKWVHASVIFLKSEFMIRHLNSPNLTIFEQFSPLESCRYPPRSSS